jgi:glycosyltransferase involved in cell wall biosynthesis
MQVNPEFPPAYHGIDEQQPLVSVVIVCYNQAEFLGEAIESALRQSYRALDVLLVDDGSTDDTAEIASRYPKVRYIRQHNRGLASARNTGLRHSTGEYVVFLDADDRLLPRAIEAGLRCIQRVPQCGFVFGRFRNIFSDGSPAPTDEPQAVDHDHYWNLLQSNFIGMHATVLYRWNVLDEVSGFDERLAACEDYDLYLRASRRYPVSGHSEVIAEYRQHESNMSRDHAFMLASVLRVLKTQRRSIRDSRHRKAVRAGMRVWREYYGQLLLDKWKQARSWSGLVQIFKLNPMGMMRRTFASVARRIRERVGRRVSFGSLRGTEPFSRKFGFDRGMPVDRYYIEGFLASNAAHVQGRVLEIGDDAYSKRFGGARIRQQDVLHNVPGSPGVTITADLADAPQIPANTFDCIIFTQTLHYIFDLQSAVRTLYRILKPGGVLLATLPGISQICRDQENKQSDCWRFTDVSTRRLFGERFGEAHIRVETRGNVLAATAFLQGLAAEDLTPGELDHLDPDYQLTITVAATKG